jgi:hypothetical protein
MSGASRISSESIARNQVIEYVTSGDSSLQSSSFLSEADREKIQGVIENLDISLSYENKELLLSTRVKELLNPFEFLDENLIIRILSFLDPKLERSVFCVSQSFNCLSRYAHIERLNAATHLKAQNISRYEIGLKETRERILSFHESLKTIEFPAILPEKNRSFVTEELNALIELCTAKNIQLHLRLKFKNEFHPEHLTAEIFKRDCAVLKKLTPNLSLDIDLTDYSSDDIDLFLNMLAAEFSVSINALFFSSQLYLEGFDLLALLKINKNLKTLDLSRCPNITDKDLENLFAVAPSLSHLTLNGCCSITDAGMRALALSEITYFSGADCSLSEKGISALSQSKVTHLCLARTRLDSFDLITISREVNALIALDLSSCMRIKEGGVGTLIAHNPNLKQLTLTGCPEITADFIQRVRRKYPKLEVIKDLLDARGILDAQMPCHHKRLNERLFDNA